MFNFYVDEDRGDAHADTVRLFKEIAMGKYEAYTSDYATDELQLAPTGKREKMLSLLTEYNIAIAAVYGLDLIISMNFEHIVKHKTEKMTGAINTLNGYRAVEIVSPMEVIENENI